MVEYVGLHNAADPADDRVVVLIEAKGKRDYVRPRAGRSSTHSGSSSMVMDAFEYWTLAKRTVNGKAGWILVSIEQAAEGEHELSEEIVATPDADESAMHDEALVEGAGGRAVPEGTKIAELADLDFEGDARAARNDLSLADARFAPDILEVASRRAVDAWAQAIDGEPRRPRGDRRPPGDPGAPPPPATRAARRASSCAVRRSRQSGS